MWFLYSLLIVSVMNLTGNIEPLKTLVLIKLLIIECEYLNVTTEWLIAFYDYQAKMYTSINVSIVFELYFLLFVILT